VSRVDLLRDIGLDVETAVILDDELSRLPERTQRVFELRAQGHNNVEIAESIGVTEGLIRYYLLRAINICEALRICPKNRTYSNRGYL